jgi:hypothetical protein
LATTDPSIVEAPSSGCACGCAAASSSSIPAVPRSSGVVARARTAGRHLPLLPAVALVLLPKCPLCVAAYLGILGSLGAGSWVRGAWGLPLGAALLALTLGALGLRALRSRDARPPLVGLAGAAALLSGKFVLDAPPLLVAGAAALMFASLWSVRLASNGVAPVSR